MQLLLGISVTLAQLPQCLTYLSTFTVIDKELGRPGAGVVTGSNNGSPRKERQTTASPHFPCHLPDSEGLLAELEHAVCNINFGLPNFRDVRY